ncbi:GNAT family N-acetyltransferase [Paenibacillus methanolicus]|uniref:N-acetylglutamate synthase-like GNAT family acetyltransferase n=1 Tax=Paenibacillus methanolicus TaxID=582686 RepID=A0A5S5C329_9BACL|nr:GNAT family N-acetyltransferase [Paenibacillus methanolicus]TYP72730.1 N-acetylglutamate synthase-like GNAT family acetyltransferase [Paenibacillus methanolicus]
MNLHCQIVDARHPHLTELIGKLDADLLSRYEASAIHGLDLSDPLIDRISFAVIYVDDQPAGCGAIRPIEADFAELKRFFVDEPFRRKGVAGELLRFLGSTASERGCRRVRLQTGVKQPEAIALYAKHGYARIDNFGPYADDPLSVCMEKGHVT